MQNHHASAGKLHKRRIPMIYVRPDQVAIRLVCHTSVIGGIIGPNGEIVSKLRRETRAKIHCQKPDKGSEHSIVFIVGSTTIDNRVVLTDGVGSSIDCEEREWVECKVSTAQAALIRVSERIWEVLAEKGYDGGGGVEEGTAYCGILADRSQIGAVLGKGGKNVKWMRKETGAIIRVLPPPACGTNKDELIQVTGRILAVKKALIIISGCLQDCPPLEGYPPPLSNKPFEISVNGKSEDPHLEFFPNLSSLLHSQSMEAESSQPEVEQSSNSDAKDTEQDIVFKLICTSFAAGGIIGKNGSNIRALQNETGASIKLGATLAISSDRIVTISARENLESWYSPAQKALDIVFTRSVEIDFGNGFVRGLSDDAIVKAKLLVPSDFANCLNEIRDKIEAIGADVHVLNGDQILDNISENEMVIEIVGEYKHVRNTLTLITSTLRDTLLPKDVLSEVRSTNSCRNPKPPQNAGRGDLIAEAEGKRDLTMIWSGTELNKSLDYLLPVEVRHKNVASLELQENELTQGMKDLEISSVPNSLPRKQSITLRNITMEITVQQDALATLYGRDGCGLSNLQQVTGVKVEVQNPEGGEGIIVISGSPGQIREAMGLIMSIVAD